MRIFVAVCAAAMAVSCFMPAALSAYDHTHCDGDSDLFRDDDVSVDFDNGSLILVHDDSGDRVEITESHERIVKGEAVSLDRGERELVGDYYETFHEIVEEAASIGIQGAKIGVKGAALGLKAALGALLLISPDYDEDDLEEDEEAIGEDEEEIDRIAKKLEKRAKRLEKTADTLERLHKKLRRDVSELDDLGWF